MRLGVWMLVLASCSTETIDRNVCGNGIVEPGEDCDSTDPRCDSCGITCSMAGATDECTAYDPGGGTAGFVCGPDNRCHAPSGSFELASTFAMPVTTYRITSDLNLDGSGDLLVQSQTSVTAVFGAASSSTLSFASIQTPIALGPAGFADIDGDGSLDTMLPTADGIAAFTSSFGVPAPFPFASTIGSQNGFPKFVNPVTPTNLLFIGTDQNQTAVQVIVLDVSQGQPVPLGVATPCNATPSELVPDDIDVVELSPQHQLYSITLHPTTSTLRTCLVAVDFNASGGYDIVEVPFTPTAAPRARAVLANLKGATCPSLMVFQVPAQLMEYPPLTVNPPCRFAAPALVQGAPPGATPIGFVPLVPPIANMAPGALALTSGIYAIPPSGPIVELYHSDRDLSRIRFADVDRDGDLDVVASAAGSDDLDILSRRPFGFLRFRFDTSAPITNFLIGDYDGNEIPDVAYIERDFGVNGDAVDRLEIAFGTSDGLLPGVLVGTFSNIQTLIPTSFIDSTDPFNVISDLAVLAKAHPTDTTIQLSLLHGSPQRAMLAFFDPRTATPPPVGSQFRGVAVGKFSDNPLGNDLLAVEQIADVTNFYLSTGSAGGGLTVGGVPGNTDDAQVCAGAGPNGKLCVDEAVYTTFPDVAGNDLVVAVDSSLSVASFDPRGLKSPDPSQAPPLLRIDRWPGQVKGTGAVRNIRSVKVADGSHRLLISLGAGPNDDRHTTGAVNLCTFDPDPAKGPVCTDIGAQIADAIGSPVTCIDAALGRVAPASRFSPPDTLDAELLVICHNPAAAGAELPADTLYRVAVDGTTVTPLFLGLSPNSDSLEVGDVSGDGIDDIVVLDRSSVVPQITVFRQCNSRETCGVSAPAPESP